MHELRVDLQVAPRHRPGRRGRAGDLRFSPHLVLAFTTEALVGPLARTRRPRAALRRARRSLGRPEADDFPWDRLDPDRAHRAGLARHAQRRGGRAVLRRRRRGLPRPAVAGRLRGARPTWCPTRRPTCSSSARVPQLALLAAGATRCVSHAGHNTVCESLAAGLPLVLAPIRDDQPIVADQVVRAGAGVRVKFGRVQRRRRCGPPSPRPSTDPDLRAAAERIRSSFARRRRRRRRRRRPRAPPPPTLTPAPGPSAPPAGPQPRACAVPAVDFHPLERAV